MAKRNLGPNKNLRAESAAAMNVVDAVSVALVSVVADVATDPRQLKPGELCRLLNSTPLGPVITDPQLRSQRERAGLRIGDGRTIDLLRYAGWLYFNRRDLTEEARKAGDPYEQKKERERERNAKASRSGRDIGELPPVEDPERRARCEADPELWYTTYMPERFKLAFSDDHRGQLQTMESIIKDGGVQALAGPRGFGKTSLCEAGAIRAACLGFRHFIALIGASREASNEMMDSIKGEFETNDLLAADYPEVCYPIRALEGINNRCRGQTYEGQRTLMSWAGASIVLPTIPGSKASGVRIQTCGITGRVRGIKFRRKDGTIQRPDLAIVDDPQTDTSAHSQAGVVKRMKLLCGAILGLAGPGKKIACFVPVTVICKGDLADQILNVDEFPEFRGVKYKMLYAEPTATALWDQYAELRRLSLRAQNEGREATAFYRKNRKAMDEGARVAWPERFSEGQLSALEHAMCIKIDRPAAFAAEYQNDPLNDESSEEGPISSKIVSRKVNGLARRLVPLWAQHLTCFIDVQLNALYYAVYAWSKDLTGAVVDYGTWPDQRKSYFTYRDVQNTIKKHFPKAKTPGAIRQALETLTEHLLGGEWEQEGGSHLRVDRCGVDSGNWSDTIYQFCRESKFSPILRPTKGIGIPAKKEPINQWKKKPGGQIGNGWMISPVQNKRAVRLLTYDTNHFKTILRNVLHATHGDAGSVSLFGNDRVDHQMFGDHHASELPKMDHSDKRTIEVWQDPPGHVDNHLLDCSVGNVALATTLGCSLEISLKPKESFPGKNKKRRREAAPNVSYL